MNHTSRQKIKDGQPNYNWSQISVGKNFNQSYLYWHGH